MKIYVASSWRNSYQPQLVRWLRRAGHEVYDFKDEKKGFSWSQIDPNWKDWSPGQLITALDHPLATEGFEADYQAILNCDVLIMQQPCGSSSHLELGLAAGLGKPTAVMMPPPHVKVEPELMVKVADRFFGYQFELLKWLQDIAP